MIGLSVPFRPRGAVRPTSVMPQTDDAVFYQLYFQTPGMAEAEFERDIRGVIRAMLYSLPGDVPLRRASRPIRHGAARGRLLARWGTHFVNPATLPPWLSEADVDFYADEFARTGFRGGLN